MLSEQLSDIQIQIYNFIVAYMRDKRMPPTHGEIGKEMGIASTGRINYHLKMLEKKGFISRQRGKIRGIKLLPMSLTVHVPIRGYIAAGLPLEIDSEPDSWLDLEFRIDKGEK